MVPFHAFTFAQGGVDASVKRVVYWMVGFLIFHSSYTHKGLTCQHQIIHLVVVVRKVISTPDARVSCDLTSICRLVVCCDQTISCVIALIATLMPRKRLQ